MAKNETRYKGKKTAYKRIIAVIGTVTLLIALLSLTASASAIGNGNTYRVLYAPDYMTNADDNNLYTVVADVPQNLVIGGASTSAITYSWNSSGTNVTTGQTYTLNSYINKTSDGRYIRQYNPSSFSQTFRHGTADGFSGVNYIWKDTTFSSNQYGFVISPQSEVDGKYKIACEFNVVAINTTNNAWRTLTYAFDDQFYTREIGTTYVSSYQLTQIVEEEVKRLLGAEYTIFRNMGDYTSSYFQSLTLNITRDNTWDDTFWCREEYRASDVAWDSRAIDFFDEEPLPPIEYTVIDWLGRTITGTVTAPLFYVGGIPISIGTALMVFVAFGLFGFFVKLYSGG